MSTSRGDEEAHSAAEALMEEAAQQLQASMRSVISSLRTWKWVPVSRAAAFQPDESNGTSKPSGDAQ